MEACVLLIAVLCGNIIGLAKAEEQNTTTSLLPLTSISTSDGVTATSNICNSGKHHCSHSKHCVIDETFFVGFRCCKKPICKSGEGRYCPEPGNIANSTRIPSIRPRKYPFHPDEKVLFRCLKGFKFQGKGHTVGIIQCTISGNWDRPLPVCVPVNFTAPWSLFTPSTTTPKTNQDQGSSTTIAALMGTLVTLLLLFVVGWFVWRKRQEKHSLLQNQSVVLENSYKPVSAQPDLTSEAVSFEDFSRYVALHHHNNDQRFIEEFEEIQNWAQSRPSCEASVLSENKDKNRYTNIVAYDHTRVRLHSNKGKHHNIHRGSDYINANYVSSYEKNKAYIACQGPMPSTFNDFWKMIWENNVGVIVMITNLIEKGRRKCDQYWPHEGKEQYKHVTVTLKQTETFANYIIRTFSVKNTKLGRRNGNERKVIQYHFTQWPDHGTPEYLLPVLTFIRRSSLANENNPAPIVIHCSAGVGRTGTYIVIHSMMQMLRKTGKVNIIGFLHHIRMQRNHLVQTEDQYVFVHDALLEYITGGSTECSIQELPIYFTKLNSNQSENRKDDAPPSEEGDVVGSATFRTLLEKQFMKIVYNHLDYLDYDFATRSVNERKNRPGAILPVFRSRVLLCNRTSAEGSDYINASFVQGYRSSHEFIVTQLPLSNTRKDFWQLIWDHNVPTLVTLKDKDWNDSADIYWPTADLAKHCPSFKVSFASENKLEICQEGNITLVQRDLILEATKDDYVLEVRQFELSDWSNDHPTMGQLEALRLICKHTSRKEGTTVLQDRNGSTSAIQFACWHLLHSQFEDTQTIDVYQAAVLACQMRPRVFTSPSHLKFLYEAIMLESQVEKELPKITEMTPDSDSVKEVLGATVTCQKHQSGTVVSESSDGSSLERKRLLDDEDESSSPQQSEQTGTSIVDDNSPDIYETPE